MKKKSTEEEIKRAMADLKAIQEEREKLQELLCKAQKEKDAASAALQQAERDHKAPTANYSDKKYWDSRYSEGNDERVKRTYEWYLSFDTIYEKLKMDAITNHVDPTASILVPGCGNSTLCEDLYKQGHRNVAGMDYSSIVVDAMKQRAKDLKLTGLRYFQADARKMVEESSNSYSIIVDKGTLDAIAAGGGDSTSSQTQNKSEVELENAAHYVLEMWRVLATDGLFVVVTTMPPDVFEPIAIAPLTSPGGDGGGVVNWNNGHTSYKLSTPEGGDVYYYCLKKLGNAVKPKASSSTVKSSSSGRTGLKSTDSEKADMMDGIKALLEEARLAKEQVDKAMQMQSAAAADFQGVTAKKNDLSNKLNRDLLDAEREEEVRGASAASSDGIAKQLMAGRSRDIDDSEAAERIRKVKEEAKKSMPFVKVVLKESSELVAQGFVDVSYLLRGDDRTCWDEDDALCVVCSRPTLPAITTAEGSSYSVDDALMYKTSDVQHYEAFEYTVQPVKVPSFDTTTLQAFHPLSATTDAKKTSSSSGAYYCGHLRVPLPSYGGWYHISYVRTISHTFESTDPSGAVTSEYKRIPIKLSQTESFSVKTAVFNAPPDGYSSRDSTSRPVTVKSLRRRGAGDISKHQAAFDLCVEDMQHIKTVSVSFVLPPTVSESVEKSEDNTTAAPWLSRLMVWVYSTPQPDWVTEVVLETDLIASSDANSEKSVRTVYGTCKLMEKHLAVDKLELDKAWSEVDDCGRVVCRIPYLSSPQPQTSTDSAEDAIVEGVEIQCGFCFNSLVDKGVIKAVKPMASGLFDSMMHDFICCEEMPSQALTTSDVIAPIATLYVASTFLSVNTRDSLTSSYGVECKAYNSLLDVLTAHGGAFCTAPVFPRTADRASLSIEEQTIRLARAMKGFISTDSCAITCSRCCSYLGEAQLNKDECDPALCEHPSVNRGKVANFQDQNTSSSSSTGAAAGMSETLTAEDVSDLRFARHCVSLSSATGSQSLSLEKVVSRTLLHFHSVFNVSNFCLHVSNRPPEELLQLQNLQSVYNTVIVVRLLNKNYRASCNSSSQIEDCIKISYRCGEMVQLLTGTETRIPLTHDEFKQMESILKNRSHLFGQSPFKDQSLAVLFK